MRHDGQKVFGIRKMFQLMGHLAIHKLHAHQLSQQITRQLLQYHKTVTQRIDYPPLTPIKHWREVIFIPFELGKHLSAVKRRPWWT